MMPFTGGPSVRVSPNAKIEIRWIADFVGTARVELFDNPDGIGTPIDTNTSSTTANDHTIAFNVGALVAADTKYYVRVTHRDPNGALPDLLNTTPLPPVFTGAQAISDLHTAPEITTAQVSWDANVIGTGAVMYGTTALDQGPVTDVFNIPNHALTISGLTADTVYQFKVMNKHAIDGGSLAEATGTFRTQAAAATTSEVVLVQPHAEPRVIAPGAVSTLSVRAQDQGNAIAGVQLTFDVEPTSQGRGTIGGATSAQATTDANGIASVQLTATARGNVHVRVSGSTARNKIEVTVVVRHV